MKKFVNDPQQFVPEFLEGIQLASDGTLKYEPKYNLIYRADMPKPDRVSIIQGSGSGHEPAHTMIVGPGMLDARLPGRRVRRPAGGVRRPRRPSSWTPRPACSTSSTTTPATATAWEMARELCEAEGQKIGYLLVNDDVAVKDSTWTVGRRGVAGNFFVIKAAAPRPTRAARSRSASRSARRSSPTSARWASRSSSCTPPVRGTPLFEIGDDEMEVGIGIHGEPGRQRDQDRVARTRSSTCCSTRSSPTCRSQSGDEVAVMVNGLGGTPITELYLLYGIAHKRLAEKGISVFRSYVGEYCTSLEMAGAHISLLKVDDELKSLLLAPAEVAYRVF